MTMKHGGRLVPQPAGISLSTECNWVLREDCPRAIGAAVAGDSPQVAALLGMADVVNYGRAALPAPGGALTRREREVGELIALGLANKQIARRLDIAKRTADTHVQRILRKLECANRAEVAVIMATGQRVGSQRLAS